MRAMAFVLMLLPSVAFAQPNILVIMADDLGIEGLSFYSEPVHSTPNLDQLAAEGMVYTRAYAMPLCSPSRAAMMTGLYPRNNGVDHIVFKRDPVHLDPNLPNIARMLSDAGYATAAAGKWHVHGNLLDSPTHPHDMGLNAYALWVKQGTESRYFNPLVVYKDLDAPLIELVQEDTFGPDLFAGWISNFMATAPEPKFAFWAPNLVHIPIIDPETMALGDDQDYTKMVSYLDALIGEVIQSLPADTIVIFTGDNGTARRFGGGKGTSAEKGVNVPLIVSGLGQGVDHRLVSVTDILPTIAEIVGIPAPDTDGQSFLSTERDHVIAYTEKSAGLSKMVSDGRWKIRKEPEDDGWQTYDLSADPDEQNPVSKPAVLSRLKQYWRDH